MDPLSATDVIQTESPENFVVIFELTRNERATKLRPADVGRVVVLMAGMLPIKLTFFPHLHSNSNSSTVFYFTEQNSNSVSFSQSQCCRLLKVLLSRFSSEVDVVLGEVVYHKFQAHHY